MEDDCDDSSGQTRTFLPVICFFDLFKLWKEDRDIKMRHDTLRSMVLICKIGNILYPCCLKNGEKWKQGFGHDCLSFCLVCTIGTMLLACTKKNQSITCFSLFEFLGFFFLYKLLLREGEVITYDHLLDFIFSSKSH